MNPEKLNEVDTYKRIWEKLKHPFSKKKSEPTEDVESSDDAVVKEKDDHTGEPSEVQNNDQQPLRQLDLAALAKACGHHWYLFIIWGIVAFGIGCAIILPVPRYYISEVKLAPEASNMLNNGSISSIASQFGVDLDSKMLDNTDAIMPDLYPDLVGSVDFETSMFPIHVSTADGKVNSTYFDYLDKYQKSAWWQKTLAKIMLKLASKPSISMSKTTPSKDGKVNPFFLTKRQSEICEIIGNNVKCDVDKKTSVICISVQDQDPYISAVLADSVRNRLQQFITDYRTKKAQNDLNYTLNLQAEAKKRYEQARREYAAYSDANADVVLQEYQSKIEDMENEMQLRYNSYSALTVQVQAARAKLREQTPAFTTLQSATVPMKPAGPKRMIFVGVCMILAWICVIVYSGIRDSKSYK